MNLTNPEELKIFLRNSHLPPKHYMGQNFLVDDMALAEVVDTAELERSDTVLEVGPGLGVLTSELAERVQKVIAIEKDKRFANILRKQFTKNKTVEIKESDILKFNLNEIKDDYKVVANIPYYLTSKLIQVFLEANHKPKFMVLMIQKEVGERVVAPAGELSILGISVQLFADAEIIATVPKTSFWPQPKVDTVIIKIIPKNKYPEVQDQKLFFRLVKIAFAGKRKQIQNTLINGLHVSKDEVNSLLAAAKIKPSARPQELSVEEWIDLYNVISKKA